MVKVISKLQPSVPFVGDTGSGGEAGAVPAPAAGDAGKFLNGDGLWTTGASGQVIYDAIVALSGGDYTLPSAAFAAGHKRIWMRAGTYLETANVNIPGDGELSSEAGAIIDFAGGAYGVTIDGNGGTKRTTGTFSVTAASTAVVGVSTTFSTWWGTGAPASPTYLFIGPDAYQIASVTDETNLVLSKAWQGPNRAGLGMFGTVLFSHARLHGFMIRNSTSANAGLFIRGARKFDVKHVVVEGCTHNIHFADSINGEFDFLTSFAGADNGMELLSSRSLQFSECHFYANVTNGVEVSGGLAHKFDDCEFSSNGVAGCYVTGSATDVSINGSGAKQNLGDGYKFDTGTLRCLVTGCTVAFNGGTGINDNCSQSIVVGNVITNNAGDGITLTTSDDATITANRVQFNAGYGIVVPATGVNRLRLLANSVTSNTTGQFSITAGAGGDTTIFSGEYAGTGITSPVRHNSGGLVPPNLTNDITEGYQSGSIWVDKILFNVYICIRNTISAALWNQIDVPAGAITIGRQTPGESLYGTLLDYPSSGGVTAGEIQYIRIWMTAGFVFTKMRCFVDFGGTAARRVRMGIYSQTTPTSPSGLPTTRVAQTTSEVTTADNGMYKDINLTASYIVPTTGHYWLAYITDSAALKVAVSSSFRANFLPVRREAGSGTTLPITAGTLTNPVSALIYLSAVE